MTLSVCLIVKDERAVLSRCLNCVKKFADEIIVVDTGSSDGTAETAKEFTGKVLSFDWCDDFSAARNFAFDNATCDYVMWLDADDVVGDGGCEKIRALVQKGGFDMAFLPYAAAFDEGGNPAYVYYRERIFLRSKNYRFSGAVHEAVAPAGKIIYSDARIRHEKVKPTNPFRNLNIYQKLILRGEPLDERSEFYYGRELFFCGMLRESASVLEHFLTRNGWAENRMEALINLYDIYIALGEEERAYSSLLKSLLISPPRERVCCELGGYFFKNNDFPSAIYWYERALGCGDRSKNGGFVSTDYCGYIPYLQLCVIYDGLGDYNTAAAFNEKAGAIKPYGKQYLFNKKYFKSKLGKEV